VRLCHLRRRHLSCALVATARPGGKGGSKKCTGRQCQLRVHKTRKRLCKAEKMQIMKGTKGTESSSGSKSTLHWLVHNFIGTRPRPIVCRVGVVVAAILAQQGTCPE